MTSMRIVQRTLAAAALNAAGFAVPASASDVTELTFYYPVASGAPVTQIVDGYIEAYEAENPSIKITAVYSGSYADTIAKAITAVEGGNPPDMLMASVGDLFTLLDRELIVPIADVTLSAEGKHTGFFEDYEAAFVANGTYDGRIWSVPFAGAAAVLLWNKEAFAGAGLDPETKPSTWAELAEMGAELTVRDDAGNVARWGVQIPSSFVFPYWVFQSLVAQNGSVLMDEPGGMPQLDAPEAVGALEYWISLIEAGAHPEGIVEWGTLARNFLEQRSAIIWSSTGNLAVVQEQAGFDYGVATLPANVQSGTGTGGASFYLLEAASEEQRQAALDFLGWLTAPERAADWSIKTGYLPVRMSAWETEAMQAYLEDAPQLGVAREALSQAVRDFSSHENPRVIKAMSDQIQAALLGQKSAADALRDAQAEIARILRRYQTR